MKKANRIPQSEMIARAVAFSQMVDRIGRSHGDVGTGRTVSDFEAGLAAATAPEPAPEPVEVNSLMARLQDYVARLIG